MTRYYPWGGLGQIVLAENESHIYPNMCTEFGFGSDGRVEKGGGGYRYTDRQTDTENCSFI